MLFNIPKQKGVIVMTRAIESLTGNKEDYTLVVSSYYVNEKYAVIAHKGSTETAICVCDTKNKAGDIINSLTF